MKKLPDDVRAIIGANIRFLRMQMFPGRGGSKKCSEAFGVSQQQWSPWETGTRTPDSIRIEEIAVFFKVPVEYFYTKHPAPDIDAPADMPPPFSGADNRNPCGPLSPPPEELSCPHYRNPVPGQPSAGNLLSKCGIANSIADNLHEVTITVRLRNSDVINFILKEYAGNLNSEK